MSYFLLVISFFSTIYFYKRIEKKDRYIILSMISTVILIIATLTTYKEYTGGYKTINYNTNIYKPMNFSYIYKKTFG
jgi:hypothetical protein